MLGSLPNPYSGTESTKYITLQQLVYPKKRAEFLPTLIPLDTSPDCNTPHYGKKFADKLAQDYRCLTGYAMNDCCQQVCGTPSDLSIRDFKIVAGDYPIKIPEFPLIYPSCMPRTK